jgi:hypothetical protein
MESLTEADRELYWLAFEVNNCAETARSLVVGDSDHAPAAVEAAKAVETRRLRRMLHASFGFREETGAPYRDARILLTTSILGQAGTVRLQRAASVSPRTLSSTDQLFDVGLFTAMPGRLRASRSHRESVSCEIPVSAATLRALSAPLPVRRSIIFCL